MNAFGKIIGWFGFVFIVLFASVTEAGAQATPTADGEASAAQADTTLMAVNTVLCEDTSCENVTTVDGALISAFDVQTRELIDSCTVNAVAAPEGCGITVPADPNLYYIEWDEALIPAGYAQAGDPFTVEYAPVHPNVLTLGFAPVVAPEPEVVEAPVNVVICDDAYDCNLPRTFDGAVVTSFDAEGAELDACTVSSAADDFDGCLLDLLSDDSGSFEITPPAGIEGYVLRSLEPEYVERLDLRFWTFIPADEPAGGFPVNVVACDIVGCTDPVTMDGAELISYQDGVEVDRCVVESEADDFDGCTLFISADKVDIDITPAAPYEDYVLVSEQPDVFESEERGRIYVWTFVPAGAEPTVEPTEAPATAEPTAGATAEPVTALPSTGGGHEFANQGALIVVGLGGVAALTLAALAALAGLGTRRVPR